MTLPEITARLEGKMRPLMMKLPPYTVSAIYSRARKIFLDALTKDVPTERLILPEENTVTLWGRHFASDLFNAAGMFKYGRGYELSANQGAGAFLAGTTTALKRTGNSKKGIKHPYMPYPESGGASNWMGLPNEGHETVAARISKVPRVKNCPFGISVSSDPGQSGEQALISLAAGMKLYEKAGIDFIELNESCPNVTHEHGAHDENNIDKALIRRLDYIRDNFLKSRKHHVPVIVKFSNDTDQEQVGPLVNYLIDMGFDGVNFGNTSTCYNKYSPDINPDEKGAFDYFTDTFGGGLSGRMLKSCSLELASLAVKKATELNPIEEFHVIRTGGIDSREDLIKSREAGISLNQWFSGYFENFGKFGHLLYRELLG